MAEQAGCKSLVASVQRVFDDRVRNAFVHSDYVLTTGYFRFREGAVAQQLGIDRLDELIAECFAFYGVCAGIRRQWLAALSRKKRFHKLPRFEVLELLSTEGGLYGFSVHFSNGSKATWMRRRESGTIGSENIAVDANGVSMHVGMISELKPIWKIDGVPVEDWDALP
jgi:hypothetical protein